MEESRPKSSYEKINYSLRPAKNIERKMLCEVITRLSLIHSIEKYRYIGFGSPYFTDFVLLHKMFGINDLVSIEKDKFNEDRFEFNKPYSCIKMMFENSHEALKKLTDWNKPSILWLDYDQRLDSNMLDDTTTFFSSACAGSMFVITVSVKPDDFEEGEDGELIIPGNKQIKQIRLEKFKERISGTRLPYEIEDLNLGAKEYYKIIYKIINDEIINASDERNGGLPQHEKLHYKQLFNFLYNDGTLMLTIGGILYNEKQSDKIDQMNLSAFNFIKDGGEPFYIKVPSLTFKEIRVLDSFLPRSSDNQMKKSSKDSDKKIEKLHLSKDDIKEYSKIYRYFPNFAESNV
jgi:hypothetical protein